MSRANKPQAVEENKESLVRAFFRGFISPLRYIGAGFAWIRHRPPLKQIGHALGWFFHLRIIRFFGIILGFRFIRNSWRELKEVTWPGRREGLRLTSAVIVFSVVFSIILASVDYGLDKLFKQLLLK